jgi:hypothetical protein
VDRDGRITGNVHTRLRNQSVYQTILMGDRETTLAGEPAKQHTYEQEAPDSAGLNELDYATLFEQTCSTCGREMPDGNCDRCAGEVYGMLEQPEPVETPQDHPDVTGHNYFVKPKYVAVMLDPHIGATEKRLVNGYWVWTRIYGREVYPSPGALALVIARFQAMTPGTATMPEPKAPTVAASFAPFVAPIEKPTKPEPVAASKPADSYMAQCIARLAAYHQPSFS